MDPLAVRAAFARAPGLHAAHVQALYEVAGRDLTRCLDRHCLAVAPLPPAAREWLAQPDRNVLDRDVAWVSRHGAHLLTSVDKDYPRQLLAVARAPAALFIVGKVAALVSEQLAVVGARKATPAGIHAARAFSRFLANRGLTITSGLALGIDGAAHEGALAGGGCTIAVCGTGPDRIYPREHEPLARRIREHGALVSQFPPGTPATKLNFRLRNRVISGLARATLVVEAAPRSGSLLTACYAAQAGRKVLAIPGSIHNPACHGCLQLLRGNATLVYEPAQVLSALEIPFNNEVLVNRTKAARQPEVMDKGYEMLLDALGFEPTTIDVIGARTGLPGESIAAMLLVLELAGHIASYPGGQYGRIS